MSWGLFYYLGDVFEETDTMLATISIVSVVVVIGALICVMAMMSERDYKEGDADGAVKVLKSFTAIFLLFFFLSAIVPTRKTMLISAGLSIAQEPVTSTINSISPKLKQLIDKELDSLLSDEDTVPKKQ